VGAQSKSAQAEVMRLTVTALSVCRRVVDSIHEAEALRRDAAELEGTLKTHAESNQVGATKSVAKLRADARQAAAGASRELQNLLEIKTKIETDLLSIGAPAEPVLRRIEGLRFETRASGTDRWPSGKYYDAEHVLKAVERFVALLKVALRVVSIGPSQESGASGASKATPYSRQDAKIYELLGSDAFRTLTNAEILKRCRHTLGRKLNRAFVGEDLRSSLNRIRRRHGFPSSQAIKKDLPRSHAQ
jgi:hypothetical protein